MKLGKSLVDKLKLDAKALGSNIASRVLETLEIVPERKVYGIDLDGVCFDFVGAFSEWLKSRLGVDYEFEDITSYYWHECIDDIKEKDFFREFHNFGYHGMYGRMATLPGAAESVRALAVQNNVWFVTARPDYCKDDTDNAVEGQLGLPRRQIFHANGSDYKVDTVKNLGIDVFIDDGPHYAKAIAEKTNAKVYLMDMPYNRNLSHPNITRVNSWRDIMKHEGYIFGNIMKVGVSAV